MNTTTARRSLTTTFVDMFLAREGRASSSGSRGSKAKTGRKTAAKSGRKPGPKPGRKAAGRKTAAKSGRKPGPKPGRKAAGRKTAAKSGRKPGPKPGRKAGSGSAAKPGRPLKMRALVKYAEKARKVADKMGDPWKVKKKAGRPPYSPRVVVVTKAIREYLGSTYDKDERTIAVNAKLAAAVGANRLPARETLKEMSKKIPTSYYNRFKGKLRS